MNRQQKKQSLDRSQFSSQFKDNQDQNNKMTERQSFLQRAKKRSLEKSLKKKMQSLNKLESEFSFRHSKNTSQKSLSNSSLSASKSTGNHMSLILTESRKKLLNEISKNLKINYESREREEQKFSKYKIQNQSNSDNKKNLNESQYSEANSQCSKASSKLDGMLKDIKRSNQLSTKAVYSIKRNEEDKIRQHNFKKMHQKYAEQHSNQVNFSFLVQEIRNLRQQLADMKGQSKNKNEDKSKEKIKTLIDKLPRERCLYCGCNCKGKY